MPYTRNYRIKTFPTYNSNVVKVVKPKTKTKKKKGNKFWKFMKRANDPKRIIAQGRRPKTRRLLQATEMSLISAMLFGTPAGAFGRYIPEAHGAEEIGNLIMSSASKPMIYGFP
jgi:hypothetical protein